MHFTQFLFPNGRRSKVTIDMPPEIEEKAQALVQRGWSFEIECFPDTQMVHMDCCNDERVLANRICLNGPAVLDKVKELVEEAAKVAGVAL